MHVSLTTPVPAAQTDSLAQAARGRSATTPDRPVAAPRTPARLLSDDV